LIRGLAFSISQGDCEKVTNCFGSP